MVVGPVRGPAFEQRVILDVDDARRLLRPFERVAGAQELPAFVVGQGVVGDPAELVTRELHLCAEAVRAVLDLRGRAERAHAVVEAVDVFPQLPRDPVPDRPGVFTDARDASDDRVGIVVTKGEEFEDRVRRGVGVAFEKTGRVRR